MKLAVALFALSAAGCVASSGPPPQQPEPQQPAPSPQPPPPPIAATWDSSGWTMLGSQVVNGGVDRDTITVGEYRGRFDQLTMVVSESDLDLEDFTVVFGNNERWSPKIKHGFHEGQRTRVLDLPGDDRVISKIELQYRNLPGGGRARVEVWGRDTGRHATPPPAAPTWDSAGWTRVGAAMVNGGRDRDVVELSDQGPYTALTFVATGSDVEIFDIVVTFGNKEKFSPPTRLVFKEGSRSRAIDLPGKKRKIKNVALRYGNLPGGGMASVEIWARVK